MQKMILRMMKMFRHQTMKVMKRKVNQRKRKRNQSLASVLPIKLLKRVQLAKLEIEPHLSRRPL